MKGLLTVAALMMVSTTMTGCGNDEPKVMPDVAGQRLDVALSDLDGAGFGDGSDDVEVLGGGTFGVVDESNWTVCDQDPAAGESTTSVPRLTVDRSCDQGDSLTSAGEEEPEATTEPEAEATKPAKGKSNAGGGGANTFQMPALVGANLQDAQDILQSLGSYILTQTDATGMNRFQVDDSNWKVCFQQPAPGMKTEFSRLVELGAVKLDESCP